MGGTTKALKLATLLTGSEAVFATAMAALGSTGPTGLTDMWVNKTFNPHKVKKGLRTDEGSINATRGMTQRTVVTREGSLPISVDMTIELWTWALALMMGNDTVTGTSPEYTHTIKHPAICALSPPSTTFLQGIVCAGLTEGYKSLKGCVVDSIGLTVSAQKQVEMAISILTDGSETTEASLTFPTVFEDTFIQGGQAGWSFVEGSGVDLQLGPPGSLVDISGAGTNQLKSLKYDLNAGFEVVKRTSNGITVPQFRYGKNMPKLKFSAVVAADKSDTIYGYADGETVVEAIITFTAPSISSNARTSVVTLQNMYVQATESGDEDEPELTLDFEPIDLVSNQGPAIYVNKTGLAGYLVGQ